MSSRHRNLAAGADPVPIADGHAVDVSPAGIERGERLQWLDIARTISLAGMIVFHFAHDLELFGFMAAGTTTDGGWALFAQLVAGSFLFLSGVSFVVAYGGEIRWTHWMKRFLVIAGAACLVSAVTYAVFPSRFIYFGILHAIAASSLIGLLLLRRQAWFVVVAAALVLAADAAFGRAVFTSPWLAWTGLSAGVRSTLDFIPLVPWLAVFLLGMAAAKFVPPASIAPNLGGNLATRIYAWPGRNSLIVYLAHQPLLLGLVWCAARVLEVHQ